MEPFISLMLSAAIVGNMTACTTQYELSPRVYLEPEHPASMESCWENWNQDQKNYLLRIQREQQAERGEQF